MWRPALLLCGILAAAPAADWKPLFNGKDLQGWEPRGDGIWAVTKDGTLVGQRDPDPSKLGWPLSWQKFHEWLSVQAWLYTVAEFDEYDLHVEYWIRRPGNSGVSIRDQSRARYGLQMPADFTRTPSRLAYEIQINSQYPDPILTGSIYALVKAPAGLQVDDEWNSMDIESRRSGIRVRVNGKLAAQHPGVEGRPKTGPIGLQLHDRNTLIKFRNLRIREISPVVPQSR
ncbi:MAG: DUF1080 domain-containing protein [Acidobacteria bacterium]|nr:DUF1080 domain-containing protein [Acidobacteriota bacterium]